MKYQVNKEYILNADESEMEMLAKAVRDQITEMAKEYAGGVELWNYSNPAREFIEVTASSWFDLFEDLCKAIGTANSRREYDMAKEVVYYTFEKEKERREKAHKEFEKIL